METRFECLIDGKKLFQVIKDNRALFTGTWAQCERFKDIHNQKVMRTLFRKGRSFLDRRELTAEME